ncbi:MAG: sugar phosphate isomerase/epimerase [Chloroflexi bacterium]|nr:sugar phosphate isomerase/epimerase [Chloroflexota bacterium]
MKLGFVSHYRRDLIDFAAQSGFDCLEFHAHPPSTLDPFRFSASDVEEFRATLAGAGIYATSTILAVNPLSADPEKARAAQEYLVALIDLSAKLGIKYLCGGTGQNVDRSLDDNIKLFGRVFGELADRARSAGIRIAFENCPHGYPRGSNLAVTPELWGRLFQEVPSPALGLEYDPSHLIWQGVDYLRGVHDFADRIYLVHAKDTEIMAEVKGRVGMYGRGWWRYRLPGYGQADWPRFFQALREIGYDGEVLIEHEDPVFHGERMKQGLLLGKRYLDQFV